MSEIIAAAEANGVNNKSTGSSSESIFSSSVLKNSLSDSSIDSIDENDDDDDDDDEQDYSSTEIDTDNYTDEESCENESSSVRKMKYTNYQSEIFNIRHQSSTINKSENDNKI